MNLPPANNIRKSVPRVAPSKVVPKARNSKDKDEEVGLPTAASEHHLPDSSRKTAISVIEDERSRAPTRKRNKKFESESTSSQPAPRNAVQPKAEPGPSTSMPKSSPPKTSQDQNDLDEDIDKIIAMILDDGDDNAIAAGYERKKLKKAAAELRRKRNSFDSEGTSSPTSSIKNVAVPQDRPPPTRLAVVIPVKDQSSIQEDPDEIIAISGEESRESGGPLQLSVKNLQDRNKIEDTSPSSSSVRRRHPNHVSIEMGFIDDVGGSAERRNPTYLEIYLGYMFNCCLSPFFPEGSSGGVWGYCMKFCFIQVAIYWAFTIVAILDTMALTKHYCLKNIADGGLENFTNMCFYIMNACLKVYSAYLFTLQQQKFAKMLKSMARLSTFVANNSNVREEKYQAWKVTLLAMISMTISILSVVFASGLLDWTPEKGILRYTYKMAKTFYIWTPEGAGEESVELEPLYEEFGKNMTGKKALIGAIGMCIQLCTRVIANAMSDLILATAATIEMQMTTLANDVGNPEHDIFPVTMENFEAEDGQWAYYQLMQQVVDDTNDTFDSFLKYIHVDNLMLCVFFVMNVFDGGMSILAAANFVYNIGKALWTYRIATRAASKNDTYQEWIRRLIYKSDDKNFRRKAKILLERMKLRLLGLGRGQFLIDENFLFRFLGTGGSVFVLQAQSRESA